MYVQYGCGRCAPEGWLSFDASPTLYFERIPIIGRMYTKNSQRFPPNVRCGNIIKGLPIAPESCSGIYASHVLEHLALEDFRRAIRNTRLYLNSSGIFRLVVPDMEHIVQSYAQNSSPSAIHRLMEEASLGQVQRPRGWIGRMADVFGNHKHLWMWDYKGIKFELENAGFSNIRRCHFNDCEDPAFKAVEELGRFQDCLGVEASR